MIKHRLQPGEASRWGLEFGDIVYLEHLDSPFPWDIYNVYDKHGNCLARDVSLDGDRDHRPDISKSY